MGRGTRKESVRARENQKHSRPPGPRRNDYTGRTDARACQYNRNRNRDTAVRLCNHSTFRRSAADTSKPLEPRHGPDNCGTSVGGVLLLYRCGGIAAGVRRGGGRGRRSRARPTGTLDAGGQEQKMVHDFRRQLQQQELDR